MVFAGTHKLLMAFQARFNILILATNKREKKRFTVKLTSRAVFQVCTDLHDTQAEQITAFNNTK